MYPNAFVCEFNAAQEISAGQSVYLEGADRIRPCRRGEIPIGVVMQVEDGVATVSMGDCSGASLIGVADSGGFFSSHTIEDALGEILADHIARRECRWCGCPSPSNPCRYCGVEPR